MKLVDILARELKEWPEGIHSIAQGAKGFLRDEANYPLEIRLDLSDDFRESIVTRAQWQEAREALSKADSGAPMPPISEAPKDATHWDPGIKCTPSWARLDGEQWFWWPVRGAPVDLGWRPYANQAADSDTFIAIEKPWNGEGLPPVGIECECRPPDLDAGSWIKCLILAHGEKAIFLRDGLGDEWAYSGADFRPIRTPEQIAAEERKQSIDEMCLHGVDAGDSTIEYTCAALYDAGYRKVNDGNQKA